MSKLKTLEKLSEALRQATVEGVLDELTGCHASGGPDAVNDFCDAVECFIEAEKIAPSDDAVEREVKPTDHPHPDPHHRCCIDAIEPHDGWYDGREGFLFCRFDARLTYSDKNITAAITWDDDLDGMFFDAQLSLESNTVDAINGIQSKDAVHVELSCNEAVAIVEDDPKELLTKYADKIKELA